jgi:hypothetical protein
LTARLLLHYDRAMAATIRPVVLLVLALQGGNVVRVDSREQGRTFYVDTGRSEIRKALRDVSAPSPAGEMPDWLATYPDATPWGQRSENAPVDFGVATFNSATAADEVFAYYESRIRATSGVTISSITRQPGRGGAMHASDATRQATVSVSPGPRGTAITVNWRPRVIQPVALARSARLVAVWYDDTKQILRLRDPATNKEYELGMSAMLSYAHSVALEPSARTDFPPWLAFYPGAKIVVANAPPLGWQPEKATDMRTYKLELTTKASVADVAAFYKDAMTRNGLTIVSETESSNRYAFEARSADRMHQVYLNVLGRSADTHVSLMDHYTLPR